MREVLTICAFTLFFSVVSHSQEFSYLEFSVGKGNIQALTDSYSDYWDLNHNFDIGVSTPFYVGEIGLGYSRFDYLDKSGTKSIEAQHYMAWIGKDIFMNDHLFLNLSVGTGILKTNLIGKDYNPVEREITINYKAETGLTLNHFVFFIQTRHSTVFNYHRQYNFTIYGGLAYKLSLSSRLQELIK